MSPLSAAAVPSLGPLLADYAVRHPEHQSLAGRFLDFHASSATVYMRTHPPGHFTASCWLVSGDGQRVLLTHHRKLGRWLQLGGHADGETDLAQVALREAREESGLDGLAVAAPIFDLDVHTIPARGSEPAHLHWDVRFVIQAGPDEHYAVSEESLDLRWWPVAVVAQAGLDDSLTRMAQRWLKRAV